MQYCNNIAVLEHRAGCGSWIFVGSGFHVSLPIELMSQVKRILEIQIFSPAHFVTLD
jgi:hypothetical protein